MDIIGVLDFLKYKILAWGNTNIYSYQGVLFKNNIIIVVGSENVEEAISIVISVYISRLAQRDPALLDSTPYFQNSSELEDFLTQELKENIKEGYPSNSQLEKELQLHLKKLFNS